MLFSAFFLASTAFFSSFEDCLLLYIAFNDESRLPNSINFTIALFFTIFILLRVSNLDKFVVLVASFVSSIIRLFIAVFIGPSSLLYFFIKIVNSLSLLPASIFFTRPSLRLAVTAII